MSKWVLMVGPIQMGVILLIENRTLLAITLLLLAMGGRRSSRWKGLWRRRSGCEVGKMILGSSCTGFERKRGVVAMATGGLDGEMDSWLLGLDASSNECRRSKFGYI
jgi:hypothetical protein